MLHSRDEALAGIRDGRIQSGQVVVLSGLGLRGSLGMALTSAFIVALDDAGLGDEVVVVTDGQLSGLVNRGLVIAEVSPESAVGGPLGLVRNGDTISVDVDARTLELEVPTRSWPRGEPSCRRWQRRPGAGGCRSTPGRSAPWRRGRRSVRERSIELRSPLAGDGQGGRR